MTLTILIAVFLTLSIVLLFASFGNFDKGMEYIAWSALAGMLGVGLLLGKILA